MHWPVPGKMRDTWRAMEEIRASGRARAIGVCNFLSHHLEELLSFAEVPPAIDQVEFHPRLQQPELQAFCRAHGIVQQAWAPVMRGGVFRIPELLAMAEGHGKTAAQVTIRWILQLGVTTIPKSIHAERLRENADVYDFELTAEEMATIESLDRGERIGPHPDHHGM
jgi:diketogulonate reductase-like aldo/keto reductase